MRIKFPADDDSDDDLGDDPIWTAAVADDGLHITTTGGAVMVLTGDDLTRVGLALSVQVNGDKAGVIVENTATMHIPWRNPRNLGIQWKSDLLATPAKDLSQDEFWTLRLGPFGIVGINFGQIDIQWGYELVRAEVHYEWYPKFGLAVVSRHCRRAYWETHLQEIGSFIEDDYSAKQVADSNIFGPRDPNRIEGFALRFFRIGCLHERMQFSNPRSFENVEQCPDCGYYANHDSSG
jgi:hypothetical protein